MKLVMLPGLDGTGLLFENLAQELSRKFEVTIISFEDVSGQSYQQQAAEVAEQLKNDCIFIIAESYSGPIAYALTQLLKPNQISGIVFLASFISRPSPIAYMAHLIPSVLFKENRFTRKSLTYFGFNSHYESQLISAVFNSINMANKIKLRNRLHNIATLQKAHNIISIPVTYIRPSKDRLVSRQAVNDLAKNCINYNEVSVSGGHFIAQLKPKECAEVICKAVKLAKQINIDDR